MATFLKPNIDGPSVAMAWPQYRTRPPAAECGGRSRLGQARARAIHSGARSVALIADEWSLAAAEQQKQNAEDAQQRRGWRVQHRQRHRVPQDATGKAGDQRLQLGEAGGVDQFP